MIILLFSIFQVIYLSFAILYQDDNRLLYLSKLHMCSLGSLLLCVTKIYFNIIQFSAKHFAQPITGGKNKILSMEIISSLEPWLMDSIFHLHLPVEIMHEPLPECLLSLIFCKELCSLIMSQSRYPSSQKIFLDSTFFFTWIQGLTL